jgi:thioredoxin-like negative regulator of GroEL
METEIMTTLLELTDSTYASFMEDNNSVVFIDFYSDTCGPCQTLLTYLPKLAEHYKEDDVVIAKVNVAHNNKLATKFMVRSVPLTVVVGKDKMVKTAELGLANIDRYFKMIDKEIGKRQGFLSKIFG